jgi:hypothetical protein
MINKKGQVGIVSFVGVVIALLFLAPIFLNVVTTTTGEFADAINGTNSDAAATVDSITTTYTSLWDWALILIFGLNILLLLVSSFFVDTHPAFLLVYILIAFFLMAFAPNILDATDKIYNSAHYAGEVAAYLPFMDFVRSNFGALILGVLVLSGIIMYSKFKYFGDGV